MFFLGVELQSLFPEFRKQIAGRKSGANANKRKVDEWKNYARAQFIAIKKEGSFTLRHKIMDEAVKLTRLHFGIRPRMVKGKVCTWPNKRTQSDIFKGMK